jgi:hypothetical protein
VEIQHLTLASGHTSRIERGDVTGETIGRIAPWLGALVESGAAAPLPLSGLADYSASASVNRGALLVTISAKADVSGPMAGMAQPLVTIGVARRSADGDSLWPLLCGAHTQQGNLAAVRPPEPWCGVVIWPTLFLHPGALEWLGDLERCIAWAWCTRPADGQ